MTRLTLGSPGSRAGKSPAFLVLRGLARSGRSRTAKPGMRIFSKNVASARSSWSGGKSRDGVRRGCQDVREADPVRGYARRVHADADELADCLVDGEQRPHFLGDALGISRPQHWLPFSHVGFVVADDGLAAPPVRVAAGQVQRRV